MSVAASTEAATTPEQAWAIYELAANREGEHLEGAANWRAIKLRAEWVYGKLLPPADRSAAMRGNRNAAKNSVAARDTVRDRSTKDADSRARKVAAVPLEVLEDYLAEAGTKASREGLLRKARPASPRTRKVLKTPP